MVGLVERGVVQALVRAGTAPVLILEGARAVGKTTATRSQLAPRYGYSYTSLADRTTMQFASRDLEAWLRSLKQPAVIDEAQLLPELPLVLKEFVDEPGDHRFILTGSASIGRAGLGGADPLARRSQRFSMSPITGWELAGLNGSLIDSLFDADVVVGHLKSPSDSELLEQVRTGGFPLYLFGRNTLTQRQVRDRISSDITAVLGEAPLVDTRFDASTARTTLDSILRVPGGIYMASRFAQQLGLDRRTMDRYLSIFSRLFLVHWLPNLATTASRQTSARSKMHPVDTSFSVEALERAGVDLEIAREQFGQVVESHVVNQILASRAWSHLDTDAWFWRQASATSPEVDLVLADGRGRLLGIEVKASRNVSVVDIAGLLALRRARGLHRGFVFYTGSEVRRLDEDIWALPVGALADASSFRTVVDEQPTLEETFVSPRQNNPELRPQIDGTVFLSYVHDDDDHAGGRIVQLAKDLVDTYAYLYGFDLDLFIDRAGLTWASNWHERLNTEIANTSFLLSVVTPRYLRSEACRKEVLDFAIAAKQAADPRLLLPLLWIPVSDSQVVSDDDPVRRQLLASQYEDFSKDRLLERGSAAYEARLEELAARLHESVEKRNRSASTDSAPTAVSSDRDVFEVLESLEGKQATVSNALDEFKFAFEELGATVATLPATRADRDHTTQALLDLEKRLRTPVEALEAKTTQLGMVWQDLDADVTDFVDLSRFNPDQESRTEIEQSLHSLVRSLVIPGIEGFEEQIIGFGNLSRHLRPMALAVSAAISMVRGIADSAASWEARL